jgi:trypsin
MILGGMNVTPKFKYPWVVSLQKDGSHFCGGTLLNPTTVITAGHCTIAWESTQGLLIKSHKYDLRADDDEEESLTFEVTKLTCNPKFQYDDDRMSNDVGVWKVKQIGGKKLVERDMPKITLDNGKFSVPGTLLVFLINCRKSWVGELIMLVAEVLHHIH